MVPLRVLVIGAKGMLGSDLARLLEARGHRVTEPNREDFDILLPSHLSRMAGHKTFDWVVNCAAYTAVDKAEDEIAAATALNGRAAGGVAAMCSQSGSKLVHISTDYVFDGEASRPYREEDSPSPTSVYGRTKLLGEQMVQTMLPDAYILRTSWLYGVKRKCFPRTMIEAWKEGKALKVVDDQVGCPTSTKDLALTISQLMESPPAPGIYHACGPEAMTWHELARRAILAYRDLVMKSDHPVEIAKVPTSEFPTKARRPRMSVLDTTKLTAAGVPPMRSPSESLADFVLNMG